MSSETGSFVSSTLSSRADGRFPGPSHEPIAIVGIGCRFPGGARGPRDFWRLLCDGVDAIREVPSDRFAVEPLYDPRPGVPGKMLTRWGGFLEDVRRFDADFFGVSPREAARMDPQQRLLLEVGWEAIEDAGLVLDRLAGKRVGVFVGLCSDDYYALRHEDLESYEIYTTIGCTRSMLAGRLSYAFGFQGPSVAVDAACASSLVAVHLACQSLRTGESELALAAGVNLILHPAETVGYSQARMLAPDGRCKAFDLRANGFVRSDGVGVVVLKPLAKAFDGGDPIYAVVRGSAVNNDGRSGGLLMTPSPAGQEAVLREAYRDAELPPALVDYVEAHGTGTSVGDPVEATALGSVLGAVRPAGDFCRVGSVKTNVGHTEGSAGIAGLIKTALCLQHRVLPPSLHCLEPNPVIPWQDLRLAVQTALAPWPHPGPAYAGVSSFGVSGTNAHAVLEEAPVRAARPAAPPEGARLLPLSAQGEEALLGLARAWSAFLRNDPGESFADLCHTAGLRRAHHPHRLALVAGSAAEAAEHLEAFLAGESRAGMTSRRAGATPPKVVFVFPGQGSQWLGMGRELMAQEPVFRAALERCHQAFAALVDWDLFEQLDASPESSRLGEVDVVQPMLFAMQVALAELWLSWGVEPDAVLGQSLGEIAAAHFAGALTLEDAARVICRRSRMVKSASGQGAMAVVDLPLTEAQSAIAGREHRLAVAVSSSSSSTVLAGDPAALEELLGELEQRSVFCSRVKVDYASHSPQMEPLLPRLLEELQGLRPRAASRPLWSTVLCRPVEGPELGESYWARNLREPVLFAPVVEALLDGGHSVFVEVSPHPVVLSALQQTFHHRRADVLALPSLRREEPERALMLGSFGALYTLGRPVDWGSVQGSGSCCSGLPPYAWQGELFSLSDPERDSAPAWPPAAAPRQEPTRHPLLGTHLVSAHPAGSHHWECDLGPQRSPYLTDHRVQDAVVLPAAAALEMALAAADEAFGEEKDRILEGALFERALFLPEQGVRRVQVVLAPEMPGVSTFRLFALDEGEGGTRFVQHATAILRRGTPGSPECRPISEVLARCPARLPVAEHYAAASRLGLEYGPSFRTVEEVWTGDGEALVRLDLPTATGAAGGYRIHPAVLDGAFQSLAAMLSRDLAGEVDPWLPVALAQLRLRRRIAGPVWAHTILRPSSSPGGTREGDVVLLDPSGEVIDEARGLRLQRIQGRARRGDGIDRCFFEIAWRRQDRPAAREASPGGGWLLFADRGGAGRALAAQLERRGERCLLAGPAAHGGDGDAAAVRRIDPGRPEEMERLLEEAASSGLTWRGVVHLWSLDAHEPEGLTPERLEEEQTLGCGAVLHLVQAASRVALPGSPRLWLVTRNAQAIREGETADGLAGAPLWGLGRVVAHEHPGLRCARIDLGASPGPEEIESLSAELLTDGVEDQVVLRGAERWVARLIPAAESGDSREPVPAGDRPYRLEIARPGVLDRITLVESPRRRPGPGEVEIEVVAAGLNFIDVLRALGIYPGQPNGAVALGAEAAGRISALGEGIDHLREGDEVLAIGPGASSCFSRFLVTDARLTVAKPAGLSFEQAATIPIAFMTAHYALNHLARLQARERVLIHAAAGGVGLAAVQLARRAGAEIFATAGSEEKRELLRSLGIRHVMDSRSLDFADEVMEVTVGRGVDVVLNSLAGEAAERSLAVLGPFGRFLEIGKRDIYQGSRLDLRPFRNSLSFFAIDLIPMLTLRTELFGSLFRDLAEGFASGALRPLPSTVLPISEHFDGFRCMAQAKHVGKIVFSLRDPAVRVAASDAAEVRFAPDRSVLITGGLGGLGLAVAGWAVERGARHLALAGRSSPSAEARRVIAELEEAGARVLVLSADVAREEDVAAALDEIDRHLPPLEGVVHAAGFLDDGILLQLDRKRFRRVMAPKVHGAWNLHRRLLDRPLRFFVLFSSAAGVLGSPGQGNYSAANAFLDALAHYRRSRGLPALSIDWGPWTRIGLAAAQANRGARLESQGVGGLTPEQGLDCLGRLMSAGPVQTAVMPFDLPQWQHCHPAAAGSPFYAELIPAAATSGDETARTAARPDRESLLSVPPQERRELALGYVREQLARVLGLSASKVQSDRPINTLGIDSLMAVELRNRIEVELDLSIPVVTLLQGPTASQLAERIADQLAQASPADLDRREGPPEPIPAGEDLDPEALLARLDYLPEAELDALLGDLGAAGGVAG